jgi:hypothetical protein
MAMHRSGTRGVVCVRFAGVLFSALLAAAICATPALAGKPLERLREEFHQETDPVQRAKLFPKFGAALLAEMKNKEEAKQYEGVLPLFLEYRDCAEAVFSALIATGRDPGRKSAGFRQLEMHLRKSLHQVSDIVFGLPLDEREPLRKPQKDIEDLDNQLVKELFPVETQTNKTPPSGANPHPQK